MSNPSYVFIKNQFFLDHPDYTKMLDPGDVEKQSKRTHICIRVSIDANVFYVPLRNNLGEPVRKYGRIGHSIPSKSRPYAGLDFRYALVINDAKYIELHTSQKIPNSQQSLIRSEFEDIKKEFEVYLRGFKKAIKKNRIEREPLYRESCLINFLTEIAETAGD